MYLKNKNGYLGGPRFCIVTRKLMRIPTVDTTLTFLNLLNLDHRDLYFNFTPPHYTVKRK